MDTVGGVPILATQPWTTNADLIADIARLGYLHWEDRVLDPTWGAGGWWTVWHPRDLYRHDLTFDGIDFRHLPEPDRAFEAVAFDPPYKLNGTATPEVDDRYGVGTYASWQDRHTLIRDGITEMARVVKPKGIVLLKCMDQVCAGKKRWQTIEFPNHAATVGLELIDRLDKLGGRSQPEGRRQVHAHQNMSTMLIFRKRK